MKSKRLTEERNKEILASNEKIKLRPGPRKLGVVRISEEEFNKNRNALSKEELDTYDLYFRKRFGIFDKRDEKNRRFQETLKHYKVQKNMATSQINQTSEVESVQSQKLMNVIEAELDVNISNKIEVENPNAITEELSGIVTTEDFISVSEKSESISENSNPTILTEGKQDENLRYGLKSSPNTNLNVLPTPAKRIRKFEEVKEAIAKMPPIRQSRLSPQRISSNKKIMAQNNSRRNRNQTTLNTDRFSNFRRVKDQLMSLELKSEKLISNISDSRQNDTNSILKERENKILNLPFVSERSQSTDKI